MVLFFTRKWVAKLRSSDDRFYYLRVFALSDSAPGHGNWRDEPISRSDGTQGFRRRALCHEKYRGNNITEGDNRVVNSEI